MDEDEDLDFHEEGEDRQIENDGANNVDLTQDLADHDEKREIVENSEENSEENLKERIIDEEHSKDLDFLYGEKKGEVLKDSIDDSLENSDQEPIENDDFISSKRESILTYAFNSADPYWHGLLGDIAAERAEPPEWLQARWQRNGTFYDPSQPDPYQQNSSSSTAQSPYAAFGKGAEPMSKGLYPIKGKGTVIGPPPGAPPAPLLPPLHQLKGGKPGMPYHFPPPPHGMMAKGAPPWQAGTMPPPPHHHAQPGMPHPPPVHKGGPGGPVLSPTHKGMAVPPPRPPPPRPNNGNNQDSSNTNSMDKALSDLCDDSDEFFSSKGGGKKSGGKGHYSHFNNNQQIRPPDYGKGNNCWQHNQQQPPPGGHYQQYGGGGGWWG